MRAAPGPRTDARMLVLRGEHLLDSTPDALPSLLDAGDLLVVNDAATLPASLRGELGGAPIELRLVEAPVGGSAPAVLFGGGDWRTRTEDRPPPPPAHVGDRVDLGTCSAEIIEVDPEFPMLLRVRFDRSGDALWAAIYTAGAPIQYSYLAADLAVEDVQTAFGARPWAVEMASASRPLRWSIVLAARRRGVGLAALTHAAGISATGNDRLDRRLPLPERFEIPDATWSAVLRTRARGGRVIAVGTTVARALEGSARLGVRSGVTDLVLDARTRLLVVDGILTGMHAPGQSHWRVLEAFASPLALGRATKHAEAGGYLAHEFGDATLVLPAANA